MSTLNLEDLRKLDARDAAAEMRAVPQFSDPHDPPCFSPDFEKMLREVKDRPMHAGVDANILKAQLTSANERIMNLAKWYHESLATIAELRAIVAAFEDSGCRKPEVRNTSDVLANALHARNRLGLPLP